MALAVVVLAGVYFVRIPQEESMLRESFGAEYDACAVELAACDRESEEHSTVRTHTRR
jgi:hypothetical protein